ncbi:transmembrane amino acid transporter protein-domain-containing protein [Pelagophyceae sp. CCMP2097]|nr:transmembrane amino acid transporter protein-domain-containing protein [Pelagophyceae sp. CCMP2097]
MAWGRAAAYDRVDDDVGASDDGDTCCGARAADDEGEAGLTRDSSFGSALRDAVTPPALGRGRTRVARAVSAEVLEPHAEHEERVAPLWAGVLTMLSTIIGGGALSLPYALRVCGLGFGVPALLAFAVVSDFSLYTLCAASRRTGPTTLSALTRAVYGDRAESLVIFCLLALCIFVCIAYIRLMRDLLGLVVPEDWLPMALALAVSLVIFPLSLYRELHRLRYAASLSCFGAVVVAALFAYDAPAALRADEGLARRLLYPEPAASMRESGASALTCLPILAMMYLCQFNVLSVHARLADPSRERLRRLIHVAIGLSTAFFLFFGIAGAIVCADAPLEVAQDALKCLAGRAAPQVGGGSGAGSLNGAPAAPKDALLAGAGGAFALSILLNTPGLVIPLRESLHTLASKLGDGCCETAARANARRIGGFFHAPTPGGAGAQARHVALTAAIVFGAAAAATFVPGVATVWAVAGASVGLFVAFILPSALYLKVREQKRGEGALLRRNACRVIFASMTALALVCTYRNIRGLVAAART